MILRGLRLENIRSYNSAEISFPEGAVLLSGDIGSGKSTILLAMDFALFGIQKPDLPGASLLRHGKEQGSVELTFEVGGKEYSILRTLKRKKDTVTQSSGHIIAGGAKKELTARELRAFVLELLGYPSEALKKNSALIYRYTVYTPQEQMRHIIEADPDERLDLIRRLFGIDKYKRIAENAETFARELRGKVREISGSVQDLDEKQSRRKELAKEREEGAKELKELGEKIKLEQAILDKKKKELDALQDKIETVNKKKQDYASLKAEFDALNGEKARLRKAVEDAEPKLKELEEKLAAFKDLKKPEMGADEITSKISSLEKSAREALSKRSSLETEVASLSQILEKGVCGTCKQRVADRASFKKSIDAKKSEIEALRKQDDKMRADLEKLRRQQEESQKYESRIREKKALGERKKDLTDQKLHYTQDIASCQKKLKELADKINAIAREIKGDTLSQDFREKQRKFEQLRKVRDGLQMKESAARQKVAGLEERMKSLGEEIKDKLAKKRLMESYKRHNDWLRDFFVRLMATIERHVMVSVQQEFNSLFQKWFSTLVMDDNMSARVDDNFSVIIEQNGYETEYSFMSGGERTAIALAYRLALNRVINDLIEKIKTKDLLILDEPTDGFSNDQMDSVRDVLRELDNKQTIIVSHEPKIESFVDSVMRFVKEDNISRILSE